MIHHSIESKIRDTVRSMKSNTLGSMKPQLQIIRKQEGNYHSPIQTLEHDCFPKWKENRVHLSWCNDIRRPWDMETLRLANKHSSENEAGGGNTLNWNPKFENWHSQTHREGFRF